LAGNLHAINSSILLPAPFCCIVDCDEVKTAPNEDTQNGHQKSAASIKVLWILPFLQPNMYDVPLLTLEATTFASLTIAY